jgi:hypothetical protein
MAKAIGALVGGAAGLSGGPLIVAALVPGVGPITAIGLLGGAVLAAAGASVGAVAGGKLENAMTDGLPEDELFVYEDALRQGRSVLIALAGDEAEAARFRELLKAEGAESVDAAREQWWIGLRGAEHEHYSKFGRNLSDDEKFYRLGFESALHARTRCKEYDQVMAEMTAEIEELERQYPGAEVAEPFRRVRFRVPARRRRPASFGQRSCCQAAFCSRAALPFSWTLKLDAPQGKSVSTYKRTLYPRIPIRHIHHSIRLRLKSFRCRVYSFLPVMWIG